MRVTGMWLLAMAAFVVGCGQDETNNKNNNGQTVQCSDNERYSPITGQCEPITSGQDMSTQPDMTTQPDMMADMATQPDMEIDMTVTPDMAPDMMTQPDMDAQRGSLTGRITRSTEPKSGGKGGLFVAVFERNPITNRDNPGLVARTLIPDADMSAANASYTYTITDIPPRAEPYYITAFLDDNNTVNMNDPTKAGPDRGDLVSLDGLNFPTVTVSQPGQQTFDIVLNIALPF